MKRKSERILGRLFALSVAVILGVISPLTFAAKTAEAATIFSQKVESTSIDQGTGELSQGDILGSHIGMNGKHCYIIRMFMI